MNRPRTGRRHVLNENQKKAVIQVAAEEPFTTATIIRDQSNNTRYDRNHIQPIARSGRIGSGYWGWMSCAGPGKLVRINPQFTSAEYVDVLESLMLPTVRAIYSDNNIDFVHDKAPVVRWPTKSLDLNLIKHLWAAVVRNWENEDNIRTVYALHQSVMSVWE
ncbi:hypothetical protein ILUMI_18461 [Ignelater luminosus]|uniref:Uncharacterized protein n=1 Tax=Ignelater luminosus TaxID=2038154 RepID=A0A8K0G438_IGNLU|nr:hypothetical protein ILUMI_18461 [Ignelater luminosus]